MERRCFIMRQILLLLFAVLLTGLAEKPAEARFMHAKNKKIHKFFDDTYDNFLVLPEEEPEKEEAQFISPSTPSPISIGVHSTTADTEGLANIGTIEPQNESTVTLDEKQNSKDPCLGIRCRIGRVCQSDDELGGAWCVCAGAGHCVDHGRRVCGSDGQFYFSHCEMHRMACVKNKKIRVDHVETECAKRLLRTGTRGAVGDHETVDGNFPGKLEGKEDPSTGRSLSSFDGTTVRFLPEVVDVSCSKEDLERLMEGLLQFHCERTGDRDCTGNAKGRRHVADAMFRRYDNNSDGKLDVTELDAAEDPDHVTELSGAACHLRDITRFSDTSDHVTMSLSEFYAALGVPVIRLDEILRVFVTSATVGTSLELKCDVTGTTDFLWKRNGHLLDDLSDDKVKVFSDGSLYINEVALYHVGNYSCQDRLNDEVVQTHLVSIRVPPLVRLSPKTRFLTPGATATIHCRVEGIPYPDVSWNSNEMPLPERPDHYSILHNGLMLQIRDVDYAVDTGTFKCRANNFVGSSEDVATIFVEDGRNAARGATSGELYQLFVVFHDQGYTVYEPGHCHMHHVVRGDFLIVPRDNNEQQTTLCDTNTTCDWGHAVNVKNTFIYVTQPELNRIVVIEVQDRLNPIEVISTSESPIEIGYVEHLDQVWVTCLAEDGSSDDGSGGSGGGSWKTLVVVQRATADVHHSVVHTQPITDRFDVVKRLFLPPANTFKQTLDFGYAVRGEHLALHKLDLNSLTYVKEIRLPHCLPHHLAFVPLAGKIFISCNVVSRDTANVSSLCLTIDYVTDETTDLHVTCGDPYVSPDSRHLIIIRDDRKTLNVYRVEDDGSVELVYDEMIDMRIGDLTFFVSERGYDLFANAADESKILYMNLASGHMEIIKEGFGNVKASRDESPGSHQPIVSGGVFSDYLMTPSADALHVIDARQRHLQCTWQDVKGARVVSWVEVGGR